VKSYAFKLSGKHMLNYILITGEIYILQRHHAASAITAKHSF